MQKFGYEFPRRLLLGSWVNRGVGQLPTLYLQAQVLAGPVVLIY